MAVDLCEVTEVQVTYEGTNSLHKSAICCEIYSMLMLFGSELKS